MATITSANSVLTLAIGGVYGAALKAQSFMRVAGVSGVIIPIIPWQSVINPTQDLTRHDRSRMKLSKREEINISA